MIRVVLSPSKAMNFDSLPPSPRSTTPALLDHAAPLVDTLRTKDAAELGALMKLSDKLSALNARRYEEWGDPALAPEKQAIFAFTGDTYKDIPLEEYDDRDLDAVQERVRILSGLYGLLRPLDLISPYRLEMGTRLKTERGASLYAYWGSIVRDALLEEFSDVPEKERVLVNCASAEYVKVLGDLTTAPLRVVEPVFKDKNKKGELKVISFYAKRARGMMADFIARDGVAQIEDVASFDRGGYRLDEEQSTPLKPVFVRD